MEKPAEARTKRTPAILIGGGGVGGVIAWGGLVAIATIASVSAIKLRRKKLPDNKSHQLPPPPPATSPVPPPTDSIDETNKEKLNDQDHDQGKGLNVILQHWSPPSDHHPSKDGITDKSAIQIDSSTMNFDDNLVLDIVGKSKKPTYLDVLSYDFISNSKPHNSSTMVIDSGGVNENDESAGKLVDEEVTEVMAETDAYADGQKAVEIGREEILLETTTGVHLLAAGGDLEVTEVSREDEAIETQIKADKLIEEENGFSPAEVVLEEGEEAAIEVMKKDEASIASAPAGPEIEAEDSPQVELIHEVELERNDNHCTVGKYGEEVEDDQRVTFTEKEIFENTMEIGKEVLIKIPGINLLTIEDDLEVTRVMRGDKAVEEQAEGEEFIQDEKEHGDAQIVEEKGEAAVEAFQEDQFAILGCVEAFEIKKDNEAIVAPDGAQTNAENPRFHLIDEEQHCDGRGGKYGKAVEAVEDNPQVTFSEEEEEEEEEVEIDVDEDEDEEEGSVEKGEGSSEGTGDSSVELNAEAVWPAESIEELSLEFNEMKIDNQKVKEDADGYKNVETEVHNHNDIVKNDDIGFGANKTTGKSITTSGKETFKEVLMQINVAKESSNLRFRLLSVLRLLGPPLILVNIAKLCLLIGFAVVLSHVLKTAMGPELS